MLRFLFRATRFSLVLRSAFFRAELIFSTETELNFLHGALWDGYRAGFHCSEMI